MRYLQTSLYVNRREFTWVQGVSNSQAVVAPCQSRAGWKCADLKRPAPVACFPHLGQDRGAHIWVRLACGVPELHIHPSEPKIQADCLVSFLKIAACPCKDIAIAGSIHHYVGKRRLSSCFALEDNSTDAAVLYYRVRQPGVVQQVNSGLDTHAHAKRLQRLGVKPAGIFMTPWSGLSILHQCVAHMQADTADYRPSLICKWREYYDQTTSSKSAKMVVALDEGD